MSSNNIEKQRTSFFEELFFRLMKANTGESTSRMLENKHAFTIRAITHRISMIW